MGLLGLVMEVVAAVKGDRERRGEVWREREEREERDEELDMLSNSMSPDLLTYKTLLEGLCRDGKGSKAFDLLEDFRKGDSKMGEKTYKTLLNALHFVNGE